MEDQDRQTIVDLEHVRILSIAYLVSAIISAVFSLFGLLYAFMGIFMGAVIAHAPASPTQGPPHEFVVWLFGLLGVGIFSILITIGVLKFFTYRFLAQRRSRTFCMVVAGLNCLAVPYGTLLGIFTFVVLTRPSVAKLFSIAPPPIHASNAVASDG